MPLVSAGVYFNDCCTLTPNLLPLPTLPPALPIIDDIENSPTAGPWAPANSLTLTLSSRLDVNGIAYGGATLNKQGVGDQVVDKRGVVGVVQKIWPDPSTGRMMLLIVVVPGGFSFAASDLFGGAALTQTGTPEQISWRQEYVAFANEMKITAHADGTGLVLGGQSTGIPTATEVVWDKHYLP